MTLQRGQPQLHSEVVWTYITEDGKRFGESIAQQPDPLGKQLIQMLSEMLEERERGREREVVRERERERGRERERERERERDWTTLIIVIRSITTCRSKWDSHLYWLYLRGPASRSDSAPHSGSPGCTGKTHYLFMVTECIGAGMRYHPSSVYRVFCVWGL